VAGGSHSADVSVGWTLTWHANCALTCLLTGAHMHADCVYWRHDCVMMMSSLSGSGTWVGSSGIRVGSVHPREEDACDAWRASGRVGSLFVGA